MKTLKEMVGEFYLGRVIDPSNKKEDYPSLMFDSKDFTTHAVCVGMTGSGKTGLGMVILEEAAIDGIPAIIIDPKGDMGNLMLAFPKFSPDAFEPWIDTQEISRSGLSKEKYAETVAEKWKKGLASWDEDGERIQRYKNSVETCIYTPANNAGIPLSFLSTLNAPPPEVISDLSGAFRDRVITTASGLLGLLGIEGDPIKSKEHILISSILEKAWKDQTNLNLASLIQQIQKPPFEKIGVLPIDTFYPLKDRMQLALQLNNLLASPGFSAWMEGEPLNIQHLLYTDDGKPKHSIISIAHLSDSERMFCVTLLLNEVLSWMRRQSGTDSLRALLYMDEIFGFFPPISSPPSKLPMITLLKQARAFGLGIVLCTQNPVDLDYKGLANCGTWFLGKLQTERDKSKVIEGLLPATKGDTSPHEWDRMLDACGKRIFLLRSVHLPKPLLFETRWTLSYMRGPLTLPQIQQLMNTKKETVVEKKITAKEVAKETTTQKPLLPPNLEEYTVERNSLTASNKYRPLILGIVKLHFVDTKQKVDTWNHLFYLAPISADGRDAEWRKGQAFNDTKDVLSRKLPADAIFEDLPIAFSEVKVKDLEKSFSAFLYQNRTLDLFQCDELKAVSKEDESEGDFKVRLLQLLREKRDNEVTKLRAATAKKITSLEDKIRKAELKLSNQQDKASSSKLDAYISLGKTILGGLLGRRVLSDRNLERTGTVLRKAGKLGEKDASIQAAEENLKALQAELEEVQKSTENQVKQILDTVSVDHLKIDKIPITPKKSDIHIEEIALLWWPL